MKVTYPLEKIQRILATPLTPPGSAPGQNGKNSSSGANITGSGAAGSVSGPGLASPYAPGPAQIAGVVDPALIASASQGGDKPGTGNNGNNGNKGGNNGDKGNKGGNNGDKGNGNGNKGNGQGRGNGNGKNGGTGANQDFSSPDYLLSLYRVARYSYDEVGNRLSLQTDQSVTSYRHDQANQLLAAGDLRYTYDANGNTIARIDGQEKVEYRYDEENRLVEIHYADGTWTKYAYDGYSRRVRKEESYWQNSNQQKVEVTQYLYDGLNVLMEFAGQDALLAEYYRANGQIVMKKMFGYKGRKGHGNEDLLRTRGGFIYYHYDGLGNVVDLSDQLGENIDKYYYDAFGGFFAGILEPYNSYGLTGKEYAQKAGLYYFGARWYAPEAGRWMTKDPYKIVKAEQITTIMITHDLEQALAVGNRTIMMHEGKIVFDLKGEERKKATVASLLGLFEKVSGRHLVNDRMLLI
ncbi:MAG: hypothetical protein M1379_02185 [Firmicutes bacterium]|nr:hypothetical protein [Bacillota bacterium]